MQQELFSLTFVGPMVVALRTTFFVPLSMNVLIRSGVPRRVLTPTNPMQVLFAHVPLRWHPFASLHVSERVLLFTSPLHGMSKIAVPGGGQSNILEFGMCTP